MSLKAELHTKGDNCFLCLRSKTPELHDALWLKEELHSQTHDYSIAAMVARTHTHKKDDYVKLFFFSVSINLKHADIHAAHTHTCTHTYMHAAHTGA